MEWMVSIDSVHHVWIFSMYTHCQAVSKVMSLKAMTGRCMLPNTCIPVSISGSDNLWIDAKLVCSLQEEAQLLPGVAGLLTLCTPEKEMLNGAAAQAPISLERYWIAVVCRRVPSRKQRPNTVLFTSYHCNPDFPQQPHTFISLLV